MKRLMVMLTLAALAFTSLAKEAELKNVRATPRDACMREWTPFALTLFGPVGLPWGDWEVKGLQVGIVNSTYQFTGLQIGAINVSDRAYGLQIGVINVITTEDVPFLPIVNWNF